MKIIEKISEMKAWSQGVRGEGFKLSFVPTMGALHEGHIELIKKAQSISDLCVVSIFVNPLQFNSKEDLLRYPRELQKDYKKLRSLKVDVVFVPTVNEMYPPSFQTEVVLPKLSQELCGKFRPGHFQAVATIVLKLFHIVKPNIALFGEKDYQQLLVIRSMVRDLNLDVEVFSMATVRTEEGLALSSRNHLLSSKGLGDAKAIPTALRAAEEIYKKGERNAQEIEKKIKGFIDKDSVKLEYFEIRDVESLEKISAIKDSALCAMAGYVENVRLIDNVVLKQESDE